jgi:hypothetical protein
METETIAERKLHGWTGMGDPIGRPAVWSDGAFTSEFQVKGRIQSRSRTVTGRDSWGPLHARYGHGPRIFSTTKPRLGRSHSERMDSQFVRIQFS